MGPAGVAAEGRTARPIAITDLEKDELRRPDTLGRLPGRGRRPIARPRDGGTPRARVHATCRLAACRVSRARIPRRGRTRRRYSRRRIEGTNVGAVLNGRRKHGRHIEQRLAGNLLCAGGRARAESVRLKRRLYRRLRQGWSAAKGCEATAAGMERSKKNGERAYKRRNGTHTHRLTATSS